MSTEYLIISQEAVVNMSKRVFVGIDTSNYTTSLAISSESGEIIHNFKLLLPVSEGERGLRQSDAVFAHTKHFKVISEKVKESCKKYEILAIGYSAFPRDVQGSYMPCFLTGEAVASMLSAFLNIDAYKFSHQAGHIRSAIYSSNAEIDEKFISFHVSGGTTEILEVEKNKDCYYDIKQIGESIDLHAGQAIDRIGVLLGFNFPCGREMENLANQSNARLPSPKICVHDFSCNLSGLENLAVKLYKETDDKPLVCAYVFDFIGKTLEVITKNLREKYKNTPIVYAGGVMSNMIIQGRLKDSFENVYFASPEFSSDNAAGIALLARERFFSKRIN